MLNFTIEDIEELIKDNYELDNVVFKWDLQGPQEPMPIGEYNIVSVECK